MSDRFVEIIEATDPALRDRSLESLCEGLSADELLAGCAALDAYRRRCDNLYQRVRALFFLYAIHRFHLPALGALRERGEIPYEGHERLLGRRFGEAIETFLSVQERDGASVAVSSALAAAYHQLAFQTLADQVRRSVRSVRGNQWMFRVGHPADHPLRIRPELVDDTRPTLRERTPVRMDLSHSCWSDIFFLGMDLPEAARVVNASVDLGVHGRDAQPEPPIEARLRVIDEPVLRLRSIDLEAEADLCELGEVFDFAKDYLGLLKAAVIAAGVVPPGVEGSGQSLAELLERLCGPGRGLEIESRVRDIPKGSRLAVSTNLLASLIAVMMRATGQAASLTGPLRESERRIVAARAILGEWIGGSGGGWQDSGGVWPGIKLIHGRIAGDDDPEYGVSRGRLLPDHEILDVPPTLRTSIEQSLILVHGGMAQDVGPILEMVTERYLLRSEREWAARQHAVSELDRLLDVLRGGSLGDLSELTANNFAGPIQDVIPWASNLFTERVIERVRARFGEDYLGFAMLGGMSGGGMGFFFEPNVRSEARVVLREIMLETKRELERGLPFAMDPVVYDFAVNENGTTCEFVEGPIASAVSSRDASPETNGRGSEAELHTRLDELGFDRAEHERIREGLVSGRLGLAQNRLPQDSELADVEASDFVDVTAGSDDEATRAGEQLLSDGTVAVVTLAAGAASRWTQGAGVVKSLHPFHRFAGAHRNFLELHIAKSRRRARLSGAVIPHVFTTSHLTHEPIERFVGGLPADPAVPVHLSLGRSVGLRTVPTERDLRFLWEESAQQVLDERAQKVRESLQAALIGWAREAGEASDYTDNLPSQCLHPVGHWYEVPNLLRNGTLRALLEEQPSLRYLLLHNIDTTGADVDPGLLGLHARSGRCLSFEVVARHVEDVGGGLARVNGRPRLVEGLAMPREEDEAKLSFFSSMTTWIDIDRLLGVFGLDRAALATPGAVDAAVAKFAERMPTYVTIRDVKKRWGHGQEDVFPVTQFERLWGDMSTLDDVSCGYFAVPRFRGQQLKEAAQLDGWSRDGSAEFVAGLCAWADE